MILATFETEDGSVRRTVAAPWLPVAGDAVAIDGRRYLVAFREFDVIDEVMRARVVVRPWPTIGPWRTFDVEKDAVKEEQVGDFTLVQPSTDVFCVCDGGGRSRGDGKCRRCAKWVR